MKNSKLLLTSLLAAASALSVPAFGAGSADTILINFTGGRSDTDAVSVDNDTENGMWNNEDGASQSTAQTLFFSDGTNSSATITWSSKNTYTTGLTEADEVLTGYLDDGDNRAQITVSNISYTVYDVVVLAATDTPNANFSAVTINGTVYTSAGGIAVAGNEAWGVSQNTTIAPGVNSMTLSGVTGASLSIKGGASANSATTRGGIAGVQIFNQTGRIWGATLSGDVNWGDISWSCTDGTEPEAKAWSAITADNLTADFSGTGTVTVGAEGVTLNRLRVLSGTTTLAGGTVTFNGFQNEINVLSGATLALNAADVALGTTVSGVNLVGAGTINFKDSFNSETYGKFSNLASFSGTVKFDGAVNLGTDALSVSSGIREFAGGLTAGGVTVAGGTTNFNSAAELGGVYVTGGTLNLYSAVEVSGNTSDSKGFRQQGGTVNLGDGTNAASLTVVDFVGSSDGRANGEFNIKNNAVMTVTGTKTNATVGFAHSFQLAHWDATETFNVAGVLNLSNVSLSSKDGTGVVNVNAGGELNLNAGLAMAVNGGSVRLNLSGGTMNIGASGIAAGQTLNLNSGTIGSLADSWTSSRDMALGGAIVVDTTKKIYTEGAAAAATASGSEVTLNGVLSDASEATGSLTKRGAGTLTLGGANTYTGATTVEVGTLVAGNATAFGSADTAALTVKTGAAVRVDTGVSLKDLTLESGTRLLLGNLAVGGTAFTVSGMASVAENLTIDVFGLASGTYTVVSGGGSINWSWLDASDFVLSGTHQTISNINTTMSSFTISSSNIDLVWNGTDGDKWSNGGEKVWTVAGSATESDFMNGDNVTFAKDATVAVDAAGVTAGTVTIASGKTVTLKGGNLTVSDRIVLESGSSTLALGAGSTNNAVSGSGTVAVVGNVEDFFGDAAQSTISLRDAGEDAKFTGTVELRGVQAIVSGTNASTFGSASKIVLNSAALHFNNAAADFTKDIEIKDGQNGYIRSYANNKIASGRGATISGNVSGAGTLTSSDDGDVTFTGTVNIGAYVGNKANGISVFNGDSTTIGTLTVNSSVTARFGGATATVNGISCAGTLETIDGAGTLNVFGTASVGTLRVGAGTVNLGGTSTGTTTLAANAGILNIGSTWNLTSGVVLGGEINIDGGTLTLTGNDTNHTATFNVKAGGTLKATGHDSFHYNNTNEPGEIVMTGAEGNLAKFIVADKNSNGTAASLTLSKNITLHGYTEISSEGGSSFNSFGGKITATGTNNTVSSAIQLRKEFTVEVTGADDALLFSGTLSDANELYTSDRPKTMVKTGDGKLTLSGDNSNWTGGATISTGTLVVEHENALGRLTAQVLNANSNVDKTPAKITVVKGAKLQISTSNVNLGTAEGTGVVLERGAKLVIDYANLTATAESTATEKTFEIMTAAVFSIYGNTLSAGDVTNDMDGAWELLGGDSAWLDSAKWTLANNTLSLTLTIPEPSMFGLLAGLGALALAGTRRRRRKA
ncbi:beta strand repeat-containing protein [Candidatus Spyradosoma sp. SGI.093]|uniref:beta strand repeat-containing protein n=1 Tax=Candidatus Spyradosoma sp. SGI.093 TaxID=3420583 RepID=UPI003D047DFA